MWSKLLGNQILAPSMLFFAKFVPIPAAFPSSKLTELHRYTSDGVPLITNTDRLVPLFGQPEAQLDLNLTPEESHSRQQKRQWNLDLKPQRNSVEHEELVDLNLAPEQNAMEEREAPGYWYSMPSKDDLATGSKPRAPSPHKNLEEDSINRLPGNKRKKVRLVTWSKDSSQELPTTHDIMSNLGDADMLPSDSNQHVGNAVTTEFPLEKIVNQSDGSGLPGNSCSAKKHQVIDLKKSGLNNACLQDEENLYAEKSHTGGEQDTMVGSRKALGLEIQPPSLLNGKAVGDEGTLQSMSSSVNHLGPQNIASEKIKQVEKLGAERFRNPINQRIDKIRRSPSGIKQEQFKEMIEKDFGLNFPKFPKDKSPSKESGKQNLEVLTSSPYSIMRETLKPKKMETPGDYYCKAYLKPFLLKYCQCGFLKFMKRPVWNGKSFLRLSHELVFIEGTHMFKNVMGYEEIENFFLEAQISLGFSSTEAPRYEPSSLVEIPDNHDEESISPSHSGLETQKHDIKEKIKAFSEPLTALRLELFDYKHIKSYKLLLSALDATMQFFYHLHYVHLLMQDGLPNCLSKWKTSNEQSVTLLIDFWKQFFKIPSNNIKIQRPPILSINSAIKEMNALENNGKTQAHDMSWSLILLRLVISQDPELKPFSSAFLNERGAASSAFLKFIRHQVLADFM